MFQMMGVFAEFERSMIAERVRAGVARAKASGTKSGKAFGRPRVPAETEQRIRDALATPGRPGFHKIAAQFGVATGTVQRIGAVEKEHWGKMVEEWLRMARDADTWHE
jgi:DNA invertase Pin-like site-specific DNA recombinase